MPKRTDEFQHLIALIQMAIKNKNINLTESKELIDKCTNDKREVDIIIEIDDATTRVIIGIECKGGGDNPRPATVEWVERMWGKHHTLPTDKLMLVSKGGFSKSAQKKANFWNITTCTLKEAESLDWNAQLFRLKNVRLVNFLRPIVQEIGIVFGLASNEEKFDAGGIDFNNCYLYSKDASEQILIYGLVEQKLSELNFLKKIEELAFEKGNTIIKFKIGLPPGAYLIDDKDKKRIVVGIQVKAICKKEVSNLELRQGALGNIAVAHGAGLSFGRKTQIVFTQKEHEQIKTSISIK